MTNLRRKIVVLIALAGLALAGWATRTLAFSSPDQLPISVVTIDRDMPTSVDAGTTVQVPVTSEESGFATFTVVSAAGATAQSVEIESGRGALVIGPEHTERSGIVTIFFPTTDGTGERTLTVRPSPSDHTIDLSAGPTSVRRDETTLVVGLVTDEAGNPVPDGSPVLLTITTPNGAQQVVELTTTSGMAIARVSPGTLAESVDVAMSAGATFSASVELRVQAGAPTTYDIQASSDVSLYADGTTLLSLTSSALFDVAGQEISDGTSVLIRLTTQRGTTHVQGEVVAGRVRASIVAPDRPGTLTITARINTVESTALTLNFAAAVMPFPVEFDVQSGDRRLLIGPVVGPNGGLLPDGTPVQVGTSIIALEAGKAEVHLGAGTTLPSVSILGVEGTVS